MMADPMPADPAAPMPPAAPPAPVEDRDVASEVTALLPEPAQGGYSQKLLVKLAKETERAMKFLLGKKAPKGGIEAPPKPEKGDILVGKLPASVIVPVALLADIAVSLGGDAGKRYMVDLATLVDDDAVETVCAQMGTMAHDKKLKKAIEGAMEAEEAPEETEEVEVDVEEGPPEGAANFM